MANNLDDIVLATPEQVERVRRTSDIGNGAVLAMGDDLAVVKQVTELDPIYFAPDSSRSRKAMFVWGIQNFLRLTGVPAFYFNISTEDQQWQQVVKTFGAEQLSPTPEFRFVKVLHGSEKASASEHQESDNPVAI